LAIPSYRIATPISSPRFVPLWRLLRFAYGLGCDTLAFGVVVAKLFSLATRFLRLVMNKRGKTVAGSLGRENLSPNSPRIWWILGVVKKGLSRWDNRLIWHAGRPSPTAPPPGGRAVNILLLLSRLQRPWGVFAHAGSRRRRVYSGGLIGGLAGGFPFSGLAVFLYSASFALTKLRSSSQSNFFHDGSADT
jgi:hypothetical protein